MPGPLYGYAPDPRLLGTQQPSSNYTDYSGYNPGGLQDMGPGNATGSGYSQATQAAVNARNTSGVSTLDQYINGQQVNHQERATPERSGAANAPSFQGSAFMDDPFFQRSDVKPGISATNRDVLGGGQFGLRGWMGDHPGGVIAAMIAAAAGGSVLAGGGLTGTGGAAGAGAGGASAPASEGAVGWGGAGTGGFDGTFTAGGLGGGNAGQLAAAGGISGGAGTGIGGSLGGSGLLSQANVGRVQQLSGLLGGGQQNQGSQQIPYIQPVLGNQQQPQQQQAPQQFIGLPTNTQTPYIPARGYNAHDFYGAKVWT